jgi:hypothetical protein
MNYIIAPLKYHSHGIHDDALLYCFSLRIYGITGWRLPTRNEQLDMGLHWYCHNSDMQPRHNIPRNIVPVIDKEKLGKLMIKIKYIGDLANSNKHNGIISIATELKLDDNYIKYKFNCCSPKDSWNKKLAYEICHNGDNWFTLPIEKGVLDNKTVIKHNNAYHELTHKLVMYKVLLDITTQKTPSWAYKVLDSHIEFYGQILL